MTETTGSERSTDTKLAHTVKPHNPQGVSEQVRGYSLVEKRGSGLAPYQPVAVVLPLMPSW